MATLNLFRKFSKQLFLPSVYKTLSQKDDLSTTTPSTPPCTDLPPPYSPSSDPIDLDIKLELIDLEDIKKELIDSSDNSSEPRIGQIYTMSESDFSAADNQSAQTAENNSTEENEVTQKGIQDFEKKANLRKKILLGKQKLKKIKLNDGHLNMQKAKELLKESQNILKKKKIKQQTSKIQKGFSSSSSSGCSLRYSSSSSSNPSRTQSPTLPTQPAPSDPRPSESPLPSTPSSTKDGTTDQMDNRSNAAERLPAPDSISPDGRMCPFCFGGGLPRWRGVGRKPYKSIFKFTKGGVGNPGKSTQKAKSAYY